MPLYLKHLETTKLPNKVTTNFACQMSDNGQISIVTVNYVLVFQICALKDNTLPVLSVKKLYIQPSNFAVSSNVDIDVNEFLEELSKPDIFEAVLRTELSAQLNAGSSVEHRIIKTAWSPSQLVDNCDCAIVTLSNAGSLEMCIKIIDNAYYEEYVCVCNFTQKYIERNMLAWKDVSKLPTVIQFKELKSRIEQVRPTAFTWSDIIFQDDRFCILVVGHYSGTLTFWIINAFKSCDLSQVNIKFLTDYSINLTHMTSIMWKGAGDKALLFIGNIEGKTLCLQVTNITKNDISITEPLVLWPDADLIRVENISLLTYRGFIFVVIVKGSDLIIYLINDSGRNIDTCVFHVGNMIITGLQQIDDNKILVVSLTGGIKELKLNCDNSKIHIEWRHIYVNINWYINQCHSIVASRNNVLIAFLTGPCKAADSKDDKVLNDLVIFFNTEKDALELLLNNPSRSFRNCWDCLETLRLNCILDKQFSNNKAISDTNYDSFSLYRLKLLLWISKVYETVCEQTGCVRDYIKSYEDVLFMVNIKMVIDRMKYLLNLHENASLLSTFQLQNLYILNNYLKQVVLEDIISKLELGNNTITDTLEVMLKANDLEYPPPSVCMICGEAIMNVTCFPPHFNSHCVISFMQINKFPTYKCLFCKSLAHEEIEKEVSVILCPFCEVPMCKSLINITDYDGGPSNGDKKVSLYCAKDCLTNGIKLNSIEEHAFANESVTIND